jgi:hypothetical protein
MTNYQVHPDVHYGVELRDGGSIDDYVAQARGFKSTAQFIEYRDASSEHREEMGRQRDKNSTDGDDDRRRAARLRRSPGWPRRSPAARCTWWRTRPITAPRCGHLPATVTWTTRLPKNAVLYAPAPLRVRKPGRPPRKGPRLGTPASLAAAAAWTPATVQIYGRGQATHLAEITCLWYGYLDTATVRVILARDSAGDLALVSTDLATAPALLIQRHAARWSIEQAFADTRNVLGAGEARNRVRRAVERTVPFAMITGTLVIVSYARHGHDSADITARRQAEPWYRTKAEPAFEDMPAKLRRTMITARISGGSAAQPAPGQIQAVLAAWHAAA